MACFEVVKACYACIELRLNYDRLIASSLFIFCGLAWFQMTEPANADLEICNKTSDTLYASYARPYNGNWHSSGHYKLVSGQCRVVLDAPLIYTSYYYYAQKYSDVPTHSSSSGINASFCIDKSDSYEFQHDGSSLRTVKNIDLNPLHRSGGWGSCGERNSNYVVRSFRHIDKGGTYTDCVVDLKGNGSSGYSCSQPGRQQVERIIDKGKEWLPWNW